MLLFYMLREILGNKIIMGYIIAVIILLLIIWLLQDYFSQFLEKISMSIK